MWYRNDTLGFLDWAGNELSDHPPIAVLFAWAKPASGSLNVQWQSARRLGGGLWWLVTTTGADYLALDTE